MSVLAEILEEKGHDVLKIDGDATVLEAVKRMVEANVGATRLVLDASRPPPEWERRPAAWRWHRPGPSCSR